MNMRIGFIASLVLNVMLVALIFMVKKNATGQAQEYGRNIKNAAEKWVGETKDKYENNTVLWTMISEIQNSADKSKAAVKRLADSKKRPRCERKPCEDDAARFATEISNAAGKKSVKVGWDGYFFLVKYDDKDAFAGIDYSGILEGAVIPGVEEAIPTEE